MTAPAPWDARHAADIIHRHLHLEGPTLPILHALQAAFGHVPDAAVPMLADALNLSRAEIHGVVSFYHDFRREPAGRHIVKLCRAEACQSLGAERLSNSLLDRLGITWGQTTPDGSVTVEAIYCLGLCACAPAALIDGEPAGRLDGERLAAAVDGVRWS